MTEAIVIALITGVCGGIVAIIGQWGIVRKGRIDDAAERARLDERTNNRLTAIEHSVDALAAQVREHNNLKTDIAALRADVANIMKER